MKKLSILLATGLAIVLIIQFPRATISPGELVVAHQKLNNDCFSCHTPFGGIANEKCMSCHTFTDIGKNTVGTENTSLFHQQRSNQKCISCHSEHQGLIPEHRLISFKHELLSASTINNCMSCHTKPSNNLHTHVSTHCNTCHQTQSWKGSTSFHHEALLNNENCASCHQKPIDNVHSFIKDNCNKCHNTNGWTPSTFDHSTYFTLDHNHKTTCNTCHSNNSFSSFTCYGCHEHSERNIIAKHNEEGIYNISNCTTCHKSGNEHDIKNNDNSLNEKEWSKIKYITKSNDKKEYDDD
jgi:hypothetical protein